jgi:hypothetical protein
MNSSSRAGATFLFFFVNPSLHLAQAQSKTDNASSTPSNFTADYPKDRAGVFVENSSWVALSSEFPSKTLTKRAFASSLTYGAVSGAIVSEYPGQHAKLQIETRRPVICICNLVSIPGAPVLVKLHPKKDLRELDGGRLPVIGAKIAEAKRSDLVPTDVVQPENNYWLVRATEDLPPGEYALMLGTQNVSIFSFTITTPPDEKSAPAPRKQQP